MREIGMLWQSDYKGNDTKSSSSIPGLLKILQVPLQRNILRILLMPMKQLL